MARSFSIIDLYKARYEMFQAVAAEAWAESNQVEPSYPSGVRPSVDQADSLEVLENLWVQETPSA